MPSTGGTVRDCRHNITRQTAFRLASIRAVDSPFRSISDGSESEYYEVRFWGGENSHHGR